MNAFIITQFCVSCRPTCQYMIYIDDAATTSLFRCANDDNDAVMVARWRCCGNHVSTLSVDVCLGAAGQVRTNISTLNCYCWHWCASRQAIKAISDIFKMQSKTDWKPALFTSWKLKSNEKSKTEKTLSSPQSVKQFTTPQIAYFDMHLSLFLQTELSPTDQRAT